MTNGIRVIMIVLSLFMIVFALSMGAHGRSEEVKPQDPQAEPIFIPTTVPERYEQEPDIFWDSDAHWLAMALEKESGVDWPDWAIIMIGEVIMNRVDNPEYADTVKEVLLEPGQYAPFEGDFTPFMPEKHYIDLAERILAGEKSLNDPDILYQALFPQGEMVVVTYYDEILNTTTYFCKE